MKEERGEGNDGERTARTLAWFGLLAAGVMALIALTMIALQDGQAGYQETGADGTAEHGGTPKVRWGNWYRDTAWEKLLGEGTLAATLDAIPQAHPEDRQTRLSLVCSDEQPAIRIWTPGEPDMGWASVYFIAPWDTEWQDDPFVREHAVESRRAMLTDDDSAVEIREPGRIRRIFATMRHANSDLQLRLDITVASRGYGTTRSSDADPAGLEQAAAWLGCFKQAGPG